MNEEEGNLQFANAIEKFVHAQKFILDKILRFIDDKLQELEEEGKKPAARPTRPIVISDHQPFSISEKPLKSSSENGNSLFNLAS